jgi:DNA-binding NtrC family response regulator
MTNREILVVDDDRAMVTTLCDVLALHGWQPLPAYDGEEAVQVAMAHNVAVVLMDVRMPGRDGVSALEEIRARRPQTRVVLMTAYAARELLARGVAAGAVEIMPKPVDLHRLVPLLEQVRRQAGAILVVDDDAAFLHSLCDLLQAHGRDALSAGTIEEAVATLHRAAPGAVLLDLQLADLAPQEALAAIHRAGPAALLVVYSGHPELLAEVVGQADQTQVAGILSKPFGIDRLLAVLDADE